MTDQHRATPEQWKNVEICAERKEHIPWDTADCILELRARVEALEAAQQDKLDRLIALDDDDPDSDDVIVDEGEQFHAVTAKTSGWRPLDIETTYGTEAATATAQQILRAPRMVEGTFEHCGETYRFKAKPERVDAMAELRAASAEVRPTVKDSLTDAEGLVKRVALTRMNPPLDEDDLKYARAAIREVAAWLREGGDYSADAWADMLEREADK
jgi:hypothetical protein